jgi:hypothetical protein
MHWLEIGISLYVLAKLQAQDGSLGVSDMRILNGRAGRFLTMAAEQRGG